ncbi:tRNA preQ1(34) S-adenosylmethionine ribosyltransferase-isomerase QueA [Christensenellaceae bacterium NSJ-63]|uniref:S-adenosylmethionine:tRNA ribosyltransferase-isomerase n=1 Tax=Guopingia tenuis TaxID=2763656 RepID=A0A926DEV8_9FIRM|nr:tRNA preQ1(34) S-adenosylmethionine ribosyltransferase-isomerase QueA [Guopingia tenuis]MBC8537640.1 tRNA preQ1(34) S-adenosylmethionine ribosyltransferase-isomerase QueA [Guopingia tenuis]
MNTKDFYYDLPEELIAQHPAEPRDSSRLMVYHRDTKNVEHRIFRDITEYLRPGDALVINETKVIPARLFGKKVGTDREVEFLLLNKLTQDTWQILMRPGKKLKIGDRVYFGEKLTGEVLEKQADGVTIAKFYFDGIFETILDEYGNMPLPPYIYEKLEDKTRYQTVYAKEQGSAAAPTAGLHFTPELLEKIRAMGVKIVPILLHVGLGTFRPVKVEDVEKHTMHSEYYSVSPEAAKAINETRTNGGRVIAVGTTSVRTLESASRDDGMLEAKSGDTSIFIYPGYRFKCVDCLITNFHLPESTLIMLVSALIGREETLGLYKKAVEEKYRVFSFGDAMLVV